MSSISSAVVTIAQARRTPAVDVITIASSCITRPTHRPRREMIVRQLAVMISAFIVFVLI